MQDGASRRLTLRDGSGMRVLVGGEILDRQSRFLGILMYPAQNERQAEEGLALLRQMPEFAGATHKIAAYRAEDKSDFKDDDGEAGGGARLRGTLKRGKVLGAVIVVARWYGGVHLGKARFQHIATCCEELLSIAQQVPGQKMSELSWQGVGRTLGSPEQDIAGTTTSSEECKALQKSKRKPLCNLDEGQRRKLLATAAAKRLGSKGPVSSSSSQKSPQGTKQGSPQGASNAPEKSTEALTLENGVVHKNRDQKFHLGSTASTRTSEKAENGHDVVDLT
mmetsp:Transcript_6944/g.12835  ORF Transcript_6944/g.12835 Transcript_6944/m.12835 type:complete len:279 (-) Transcript_6944:1286-2122(-)